MRSTAVLVALVLLAGCSINPGKEVPREAANAMVGSPETITAIAGLAFKGKAATFDIPVDASSETSQKSAVPFLFRAMSFRKGQWRQDETRVADSPGNAAVPQTQTTALDGGIAFDMNPDGTTTRLSEDEAKIRRAELYHHPLGYLWTVFFRTDPPLSNTRTEGDMQAVDMTVEGVTYTMYIDGSTKLPSKIVSKIHHSTLGDVDMETSFSDYVDVHGHKLPAHIVRKLGRWTVADINLDQQFSGPDLPNLDAPAEVKSANAANR